LDRHITRRRLDRGAGRQHLALADAREIALELFVEGHPRQRRPLRGIGGREGVELHIEGTVGPDGHGHSVAGLAGAGAGGSFQMSTTQRHWPSGSLRQTVMARPGMVTGAPPGPGSVISLVLRM